MKDKDNIMALCRRLPVIKTKLNIAHPVEVNSESDKVLRKSVYECARGLMKEGYSMFIHYDIDGDDAIAFLFFDISSPSAVGACCFRQKQFSNIPVAFWVMHWIWLLPEFRMKGLFSKSLEHFNKRFGYWHPEPPFSDAMQCFLKKHEFKDPLQYFNSK